MTSPHHKPRKRFGQHFLSDESVLLDMQRVIAPKIADHMVEIGPGLGVLTRHLIDSVHRYDAIEIDRDLVAILKEAFSQHDNLTLHLQDVLSLNWFELATEKPMRVVGNLPYNISTPLLFDLFDAVAVIEDMHFLLQKEVGLRLAAPVGSSNYSRLTVMTHYFCDVELLFLVDPDAFTPPPKVDSVFVRLIPKRAQQIKAVDIKKLTAVVACAFNQRRKTLRNSLKDVLDDVGFAQLDIDPQRRAQDLSVEDFVRIANFVQ